MPDIDKALKIFSREEEEKVTRDHAKKIGVPYANLVGYPFTPDVLSIVPKEICTKYSVIAYYKLNNDVKVASSHPENPSLIPALKELSAATGFKFYLYLCSDSSLRYGLAQLEFVKEAPKTLEKHVIPQEFINSRLGGAGDLKTIGNRIATTPVTEILDIVFAGAIHLEASDIHIEAVEGGARVRYRLDGILQDIAAIPDVTFKAVRNRIKYLAKLKLNVYDAPQDGRFNITIGTQEVDVRVSLIPGAWGEVIVMRLLNPSGEIISLEALGFREDALAAITEAISKPNGAIFNTGPTGSGKTTTLYAILQKLNKPEVKIITLEDPIEYRIKGVDQSQVNPAKKYDFSSGLKHVLRQDPDVIMVGEVRDLETAATALQAALTGHLVLTTLHTNSAPSAIPRLLDMGVKPFLLSGSINLIIAQRLVRKICSECKGKGGDAAQRALPGGACQVCKGTGYKGRIAIIETMKITPRIEALIASAGTIAQFEAAAREDGMVTMFADGMEKVRLGITTEEEVRRVTNESVS